MAEPLRALIVDDEPAARTRLSMLCADLDGVVVVGTASDGRGALEALERTRVDVLFLDIEMPGMSGMALAQAICGCPHGPAIVFVTAFERFAVAAFGVDAAGYLLKPVDPDLLVRALAKVAAASRPSSPARAPDAFWIPDWGRLLRVPVDEVEWIGAEGDYVRLHIAGRSYLLAERLHALEARLDPQGFRRVHRSSLVRLQRVTGLAHAGAGAWTLTLASGATLPVGRLHLAALREALGAA